MPAGAKRSLASPEVDQSSFAIYRWGPVGDPAPWIRIVLPWSDLVKIGVGQIKLSRDYYRGMASLADQLVDMVSKIKAPNRPM